VSTRGAESFSSRTDSAKSRLQSPLPKVLEGDGTTEEEKWNLDSDVGKEELHDDGRRPLHASSKRSTVMKDRIISMDSEAPSSVAYTPVLGIVLQLQVRQETADDGHGSPSPLPSPITPSFASAMRMKIEDGRNEKSGVVSEDRRVELGHDSRVART